MDAYYRPHITSLPQLSDMGQCNLYFSSVVREKTASRVLPGAILPWLLQKTSRSHGMLPKKPTSTQGTATPANSNNLWLAGPNDEAAFRPPSHPNPREGGSAQKQKEQEARLLSICRALAAVDTFPVSTSCPVPPGCSSAITLHPSVPEETKWCLFQMCCGTLAPPPQTLNKLLPMGYRLLKGADRCDERWMRWMRI